MNFVEELRWRGMMQDIMPGTQEQFAKEMTSEYTIEVGKIDIGKVVWSITIDETEYDSEKLSEDAMNQFNSIRLTDVRIQQINTKNIPVYGIVLRNAFPTGMADISLDNTAENSIQKFSVTFAYDKWEQENALESTIGALRSLKKLI